MRLALQPGATSTAVFALAWYMPHLLAAERKWEYLVRASSAPPPPMSPNRCDYGHAYNQWFQDSWIVAEYGLQQWSNIRDRVLAWPSALINPSLPPRFALMLCNALFPVVSNTWYTRAGLYPYYGAGSYVTGLYLAALKVGEIVARECGDAGFGEWARAQFWKVQRVFETELWNEAYGYYISWRDKQARA